MEDSNWVQETSRGCHHALNANQGAMRSALSEQKMFPRSFPSILLQSESREHVIGPAGTAACWWLCSVSEQAKRKRGFLLTSSISTFALFFYHTIQDVSGALVVSLPAPPTAVQWFSRYSHSSARAKESSGKSVCACVFHWQSGTKSTHSFFLTVNLKPSCRYLCSDSAHFVSSAQAGYATNLILFVMQEVVFQLCR